MTTKEGPWTEEEKAVLDKQKKFNAQWHKDNRESGRNEPHWSWRKAAPGSDHGDDPQEISEEAWDYLFSPTPETATQRKKQRKMQFKRLTQAIQSKLPSKQERDRIRSQQLSAAAIKAYREREANRLVLSDYRAMIICFAASRRPGASQGKVGVFARVQDLSGCERAAALEPLRSRGKEGGVAACTHALLRARGVGLL